MFCLCSSDKLRLELTQRHSAEMDQLARAHKTQMAAARMELERAIELRQQQVRGVFSVVREFCSKALTCLCTPGALLFHNTQYNVMIGQ